jgi:hypothetical protein
MAGLIDLLAGGAPTAPDEVSGGIAAQLAADPARLAYGSGPVGQALGQISGGFYQDQARAAAQRIAQAHTESLPALLKAYASDEPFTAIANDPSAPAYAKWMVGQQTPLQVAQTKAQLAGAGLTRAETPGVAAISRQRVAGPPSLAPDGGAPTAGAPSAAAAASAAPEQLSPATIEAYSMPPGPQRDARLARLPAGQKRLLGRMGRPPAAAPQMQTPAAPTPDTGGTMAAGPATST